MIQYQFGSQKFIDLMTRLTFCLKSTLENLHIIRHPQLSKWAVKKDPWLFVVVLGV